MKVLASIDIGSNAIRMLFEQVNETANGPVFKKLSLIRLPVRLGEDVFLKGEVSKKKTDKVIHIAHSFNHLCQVFGVEEYIAVATSAMREAKNGHAIVEQIKKETGVHVRIIQGDEEAEILYESIVNTGKIDSSKSYVFIDVGGGSTEINLFCNGIRKKWESFNLGTVRIKEGIQDEMEWNRMEKWIKKNIQSEKPGFAVGTGGNINKLYKLCDLSNWQNLNLKVLEDKIEFLSHFSQNELIQQFDLKSDRADVIVQGGEIYLKAMKTARLEKMIVPKVGLADGLIRRMYFNGGL